MLLAVHMPWHESTVQLPPVEGHHACQISKATGHGSARSAACRACVRVVAAVGLACMST